MSGPRVPSPRPAEEIRADLAAVDNTSGGLCYSLGGTRRETFRLAHDVAPLLADRERLSAELADARAENERLQGPFRCCEHCADDREYHAENPPDSHDMDCTLCDSPIVLRAERDRLRVRAEASKPAASDEPARCPHGKTGAHEYESPLPWSNQAADVIRCPGPAASGTPETTE